MRRVIVRYRVRPEQADRNEELVKAVYEELGRLGPPGFRYSTFRLEDGVTFVHMAEAEDGSGPLGEMAAFREFQREIAERCEEQPVVSEARVIGSYRSGDD